jgi:hypothetical protein
MAALPAAYGAGLAKGLKIGAKIGISGKTVGVAEVATFEHGCFKLLLSFCKAS